MQVAQGRPCPLCEQSLGAHALGAICGDESPLRLTLSGLPVLRCATGHVYFAQRELPLWLMNRLVEEDAPSLPAGEGSGLLFRRYRCGSCRQPLARSSERRQSFRFEVVCAGLPGFVVVLAMPVFRCTGCAREQVRSLAEVRRLAPAALVHAFKGAGIRSTG